MAICSRATSALLGAGDRQCSIKSGPITRLTDDVTLSALRAVAEGVMPAPFVSFLSNGSRVDGARVCDAIRPGQSREMVRFAGSNRVRRPVSYDMVAMMLAMAC
jgi:hypothetical protein